MTGVGRRRVCDFPYSGYVEAVADRWFDRNVHGGMGIMIDDIVAG